MSIGVEHDADGLALVGRASGWSTGGGSSQEPSEQRIFVAYGLVGHYGDLTVARRRDESDDAAPLEKAEDAFARALDDGLDVLLGRCWGRALTDFTPSVSPHKKWCKTQAGNCSRRCSFATRPASNPDQGSAWSWVTGSHYKGQCIRLGIPRLA